MYSLHARLQPSNQCAHWILRAVPIAVACLSLACTTTPASDGDVLRGDGGATPPAEAEPTGPPALPLPTAGGETVCSPEVAGDAFPYALCACENVWVTALKTGSFDSLRGRSMGVEEGGAAVGVNGHLESPGIIAIGGSLITSGAEGVTVAGADFIAGDLKVDGPLRFAGFTSVYRDAWLGYPPAGAGFLRVGRDLYRPAGFSGGFIISEVGGETHTTDVSVPPPCDCRPDSLIDVGGMVDAAATDNDNAAVGLSPSDLHRQIVVGRAELPGGRLYVNAVGGAGALELVVNEPTALFVDGDFEVRGALNVEMGPRGELDLFVKGDLRITGAAKFGNLDRPAAARIYVGGGGEVRLVGATGFVGNLYAPRAAVTSIGATAIMGSVFAREVVAPGLLVIGYDAGILEGGDRCDENPDEPPPGPPPGCNNCGDCPSTEACVDGSCGACRTDADCCEPLVCTDGQCLPLLY